MVNRELNVSHCGPVGAGDYNLPYDRLTPSDRFEAFCRELVVEHLRLNKNYYSVTCRSNGTRGCAQGGGDFLITITDHNKDTYYHLYEIKSGNTLSCQKYTNALDKFVRELKKWDIPISTFCLITASPSHALLDQAFRKQRDCLEALGIDHQLYDALDLAKWMETVKSPTLLTEFFGKEYVERFLGKEALWQIENDGLWGRKEIEGWSEYKGPQEYNEGNYHRSINEHVIIQASLPKPDNNTLSCLITLRHHDYNHLLLTLSQDYLLKRAFAGRGSPVRALCRPWIKSYKNDEYFCDIENCRIVLSHDSIVSICNAFDKLWLRYQKSIMEMDTLYQSSCFRDDGYCSVSIPMMEIPLWLWNRLVIFCEHHNFLDEGDKWNIFNTVTNKIMVFNTRRSDVFPGKDVYFRAAPSKYENKFNVRNVVLLWEVPDLSFQPLKEIINPDNYCDVLTTHNWIKDVFIPYAFNWFEDNKNSVVNNRRKKFSFLRKREKKEYLEEWMVSSLYQSDYLISPLLIDKQEDLDEAIKKLQAFYHSCPDYISFDNQDMQTLLQAFSLFIKRTEFTYVDYICGCIGANDRSREGIISRIEDISSWTLSFEKRHSLIDMIFRSMIACQRDGKIDLFEADILTIKKMLTPFIEMMNDEKLLKRQRVKHELI